jgi:hypothetical protein
MSSKFSILLDEPEVNYKHPICGSLSQEIQIKYLKNNQNWGLVHPPNK